MKNKKDTKQSLRKIDIVERGIRETLERCGVGLTLGELKKVVFKEEGYADCLRRTR